MQTKCKVICGDAKPSRKECIISPIFYMGNKKKLINKGLIDLFPENINTFVDVFAGSAVVSMNTDAKNYVLNDASTYLFGLYGMFRTFPEDAIIQHIEDRIEAYGLARERTKRNGYKDRGKIEQYKVAYILEIFIIIQTGIFWIFTH